MVKKILTNALKGLVEGEKYFIKLSDDDMMEPVFIDKITEYYKDVIYDLGPIDENCDLGEVIDDTTYDLAKNEETQFYIDVGLDREDWVGTPVKSVEELADKIMEFYFPHIKE